MPEARAALEEILSQVEKLAEGLRLAINRLAETEALRGDDLTEIIEP